jgi:hypothetical protein
LLIPGENDSDGEIDALSRWVTNTLGSDAMSMTGRAAAPGAMGAARY